VKDAILNTPELTNAQSIDYEKQLYNDVYAGFMNAVVAGPTKYAFQDDDGKSISASECAHLRASKAVDNFRKMFGDKEGTTN
jgi:hypothetical protein